MSDFTDLVQALQRLRLVDDAQVNELVAACREKGADAADLVNDLSQRGRITSFQAEALLQGRGDDLLLGPLPPA